ncbi:MAG TPA: type II toxin-antitoxin system RelE/ParE family toxin [Bacteroidia bacterium]|jgi:toxin ParE1/3/4|nr:type II toxin-antitoxin system RelE/ParE family toxin [Bacteroidia bacterium]
MPFAVFIEPRALADIQQAMDYYDTRQSGLGKRFETAIDKHFSILSKNPFFQIRYNGIRCIPVKKFPFLIHFVVDEKRKEVFVISVFHTSKNNKEWLI